LLLLKLKKKEMYNLKHLKAYVQGKFLRLHIIVSIASSLLPDLLHHFLAPSSEGNFDPLSTIVHLLGAS